MCSKRTIKKIYGDRVLSAGKRKDINARFNWKDCKYFELLKTSTISPTRVRVIHYDDNDSNLNIPCLICKKYRGQELRYFEDPPRGQPVPAGQTRKKLMVLIPCKRCNSTFKKLSLKDVLPD